MKFSWFDSGRTRDKEDGRGPVSGPFNVPGRRIPQNDRVTVETGREVSNRPIEPEGSGLSKVGLLKWAILALVFIYVALSYYHAPILERIGAYLVVSHPVKQADLMACLMGKPVERGLAAVDIYDSGFCSRIFIAKETPADGADELRERGMDFPGTGEVLTDLLIDLGVSEKAVMSSGSPVGSTFEEAKRVRTFALEMGYRSLIVVTSPTHTRRAWITYKKIFEKSGIDIMMVASEYSGFDPKTWWKNRAYAKEVFYEYQKLLYYLFVYKV